jgi:hypothetical protein
MEIDNSYGMRKWLMMMAFKDMLTTPQNHAPIPYIPLKGYKNHSPMGHVGLASAMPLCPDGEGQGHRDTRPHIVSRTRAKI